MTWITNSKNIQVLLLSMILLCGCYHNQPKNYGKVDTALFLSDAAQQPLVVAFGGSEGGNIYAHEDTKEVRELFLKNGFSFLSIGYFNSLTTPAEIDRISISAIYDTIRAIANHPKIDKDQIILLGGSRGGELVLNIASHYSDFAAIVAIVAPNVNLPSRFGWNATSSWTYKDEELPYVPASNTSLQKLQGSFYDGILEMVKENGTNGRGTIEVEKINCPILFISAKNDEVWPSTLMAEKMTERLKKNNFRYFYQHIAAGGNHSEPARHFDLVIDFLATLKKSKGGREHSNPSPAAAIRK